MTPRRDELVPVLMLVPYFAPQTHAAMFRAHKLAKYLPEHGFRPVVVTTDINYLYNEDPRLLSELPNCVQVHRARYVEPTLRGLRMALGGRDRTFAALKRAGHYANAAAGTAPPAASKPRGESFATTAVRLLGEWPDRYWTWAISARRLCRRLVREQDIKLLYTTAVPISPLMAASKLRNEFGLRWLADFRDPVGYGKKNTADGPLASLLERRLIQSAMDQADHVAGLAGAYGGIFFDLYGVPEHRYSFIPTGLDEAYLDATAPDPRPVFMHVGEVMPNQSPHVFAVLARAAAIAPAQLADFRLEVVGRREINQPRIEAMLSTVPGWSMPVDYIDHLPQAEVYARLRSARAALLVPGQARYWWTSFAKLVDYIALATPVIADVPPISEAREELGKAGNAHFLSGHDVEGDAQALLQWLADGPTTASSAYGQRYTARRQAADFAALLGKLHESAGGGQ